MLPLNRRCRRLLDVQPPPLLGVCRGRRHRRWTAASSAVGQVLRRADTLAETRRRRPFHAGRRFSRRSNGSAPVVGIG